MAAVVNAINSSFQLRTSVGLSNVKKAARIYGNRIGGSVDACQDGATAVGQNFGRFLETWG